jgi:hypothetical protein
MDEPGAGPERREAVQPPAAPELPESGSPASLIRRFQAELADFLGTSLPDSIQPQGEAHSAPLDEAAYGSRPQAGEPTVSEAPLAPEPSGPPGLAPGVQANRPDAPTNRPAVDSAPAAAPDAGDALAPARVTRLRLRPPLAGGAPPAEAKSSPPLGLQASAAISPELGDRDNPPAPRPIPAAAGEPAPRPASPRVTRLRLSGPRSTSPVDGSPQFAPRPPHPAGTDAASPPGVSLSGLKIGPAAAPPETAALLETEAPAALQTRPAIQAPLEPQSQFGTQGPPPLPVPPALQAPPGPQVPVGTDAAQTGQSSAPAETPQGFVLPVAAEAPEPVWPPRLEQTGPLPTRWPAADNEDHWPALPEPQPWRDPGPRPYQNQARRRRIDREQGGGSWKG